MYGTRALKILATGDMFSVQDNDFHRYLDFFAFENQRAVLSFIKPWYLTLPISFLFWALYNLSQSVSETTYVIGMLAPIALAARQTCYNVVCYIAWRIDPRLEEAAFYAVGAAESFLLAGATHRFNAQHNAANEAAGMPSGGRGISTALLAASGVAQSAMAIGAYHRNMSAPEPMLYGPEPAIPTMAIDHNPVYPEGPTLADIGFKAPPPFN